MEDDEGGTGATPSPFTVGATSPVSLPSEDVTFGFLLGVDCLLRGGNGSESIVINVYFYFRQKKKIRDNY